MAVQGALPVGAQGLLPIFLFLSVGAVSLFSFIGVAVWSDARRREREAYYKHEVFKKMAETQGAGVASAIELLRQQERIAERRCREGTKLGGLVTAAIGVGLLLFLRALVPDRPIYLSALIPLLIGGALLAYSFVLAPKR